MENRTDELELLYAGELTMIVPDPPRENDDDEIDLNDPDRDNGDAVSPGLGEDEDEI